MKWSIVPLVFCLASPVIQAAETRSLEPVYMAHEPGIGYARYGGRGLAYDTVYPGYSRVNLPVGMTNTAYDNWTYSGYSSTYDYYAYYGAAAMGGGCCRPVCVACPTDCCPKPRCHTPWWKRFASCCSPGYCNPYAQAWGYCNPCCHGLGYRPGWSFWGRRHRYLGCEPPCDAAGYGAAEVWTGAEGALPYEAAYPPTDPEQTWTDGGEAPMWEQPGTEIEVPGDAPTPIPAEPMPAEAVEEIPARAEPTISPTAQFEVEAPLFVPSDDLQLGSPMPIDLPAEPQPGIAPESEQPAGGLTASK